MIQINDTKNLIGITIHGDYKDLNALYDALSGYLHFYFDHQDINSHSSCYDILLGLCYDLRHAYQGDRNIESVENNHENIAQLASCIYQIDEKAVEKERRKYKNGNLYFNVEVLYPWALYYLYTLQSITDDYYQHSWFQDIDYNYTEYQAERDLALIQYFIHLLWNKLEENLPDHLMKALWDYTRLFNHAEYYFYYYDIYIEWLCSYWIKIPADKKQRLEQLPLLCLELSAVVDEDTDEFEEEFSENSFDSNKNKASDQIEDLNKKFVDSENSNNINPDFEENLRQFQSSVANTIQTCQKLYDQYFDLFHEKPYHPYQGLYSFLEIVDDHVRKHGQFTEVTYDDWLDEQFGSIDWDQLEW